VSTKRGQAQVVVYLQVSITALKSLLSWRTEVWALRRSFLVVSSANQRSTGFSLDELVGVKCRTNLGWAVSQRLTAGVLCVQALSSRKRTPSSLGTGASISC
jgi:hypothetical protein